MINEKSNAIPVLYIKDANIPLALKFLSKLQKEHNLEAIPRDIIEIRNCFNWQELKKEIPNSLVDWQGAYLLDSFMQKWDFDDKVYEAARATLMPALGNIGLSIKYLFLWKIISSILFSKSKFHSELVLESTDDLECSVLLAKEQYFKQAFQVLRNYCEVCVAFLYFSIYENEFKEWMENIEYYHFPDFKKEMLVGLKDIFDDNEIDFLAKQYSRLNNSVHSKRARINMNLERLNESVYNYGEKDYRDWSGAFNRIVHFMIKLFLEKIIKTWTPYNQPLELK